MSNGYIGMPGVTDIKHAKNYTGNTHGSLIEINGNYYVFYHRHTNRKQFSRQACAERIRFENGKFYQAEMTSCGLNNGSLKGHGKYPSYIACNLYGRNGTMSYSMIRHRKGGYPYITRMTETGSRQRQRIYRQAEQWKEWTGALLQLCRTRQFQIYII